MLGSFVLHCLPEFAEIHDLWVGDTSLPSYPRPLPFPFAFPASRSFALNWLFTSGDQSSGTLASVLPMNIFLVFFITVKLIQNKLNILKVYHLGCFPHVYTPETVIEIKTADISITPEVEVFLYLFKKLKYTWFTLLLISSMQQSASLYIYTYIFTSIIFYHRLLNIVPCAIVDFVDYPSPILLPPPPQLLSGLLSGNVDWLVYVSVSHTWDYTVL